MHEFLGEINGWDYGKSTRQVWQRDNYFPYMEFNSIRSKFNLYVVENNQINARLGQYGGAKQDRNQICRDGADYWKARYTPINLAIYPITPIEVMSNQMV